MKLLDSFNHENLIILEKNGLLKPLIKTLLIKSILSKVFIDEELKKSTLESFKVHHGLNKNNEIEYNNWLREHSIESYELEDLALSKVRLKNYCQEHFAHKVNARFLENKNHLDIVVYSLIRVKDFYKAREIYWRLSSGEEEFGSLSAQFSEGDERKRRGVVGPAPVDCAHPKLIAALMSDKKGEIQPPMEVAGMHVIVRLESYDSAKLDSLTREKLEKELFHQWIDEESTELKNVLLTKHEDILKVCQ